MNIASTSISPSLDRTLAGRSAERPEGSEGSFKGMLKEFVEDVNAQQQNAEREIEKLTTGETSNIHEVMVAVEEAGIAMDLVLEIRNKTIEGYQELMRMQI